MDNSGGVDNNCQGRGPGDPDLDTDCQRPRCCPGRFLCNICKLSRILKNFAGLVLVCCELLPVFFQHVALLPGFFVIFHMYNTRAACILHAYCNYYGMVLLYSKCILLICSVDVLGFVCIMGTTRTLPRTISRIHQSPSRVRPSRDQQKCQHQRLLDTQQKTCVGVVFVVVCGVDFI